MNQGVPRDVQNGSPNAENYPLLSFHSVSYTALFSGRFRSRALSPNWNRLKERVGAFKRLHQFSRAHRQCEQASGCGVLNALVISGFTESPCGYACIGPKEETNQQWIADKLLTRGTASPASKPGCMAICSASWRCPSGTWEYRRSPRPEGRGLSHEQDRIPYAV